MRKISNLLSVEWTSLLEKTKTKLLRRKKRKRNFVLILYFHSGIPFVRLAKVAKPRRRKLAFFGGHRLPSVVLLLFL